MRVIIERCCGLDVHQETVVACLLIGAPGDRPTKEVRTFRTVTRDLEALRDWLAAGFVVWPTEVTCALHSAHPPLDGLRVRVHRRR